MGCNVKTIPNKIESIELRHERLSYPNFIQSVGDDCAVVGLRGIFYLHVADLKSELLQALYNHIFILANRQCADSSLREPAVLGESFLYKLFLASRLISDTPGKGKTQECVFFSYCRPSLKISNFVIDELLIEDINIKCSSDETLARGRKFSPGEIINTEEVDKLSDFQFGLLGEEFHLDLGATLSAPVSGEGNFSTDDENTRLLSWSGHCDTYSESMAIACLEGLERLAGAGMPDFVTMQGDKFLEVPKRQQSLVAGENYLTKEKVYFRTSDIFYGGVREADTRPETSNGCASGATIEEAVLFGALEVVERDAFLMTWYSGEAPVKLIIDNRFSRLWEKTRRAFLYGIKVSFYYCQSAIGFPVIVAVGETVDSIRLTFGSACDISAITAAESALDEVCSFLPNRQKQYFAKSERAEYLGSNPEKVMTAEDHWLLYASSEGPNLASNFCENVDSNTLTLEEVESKIRDSMTLTGEYAPFTILQKQMSKYNYRLLVFNETLKRQASLGLFSVRVVIPDLVPLDFGWLNQRIWKHPRFTEKHFKRNLIPHPLS